MQLQVFLDMLVKKAYDHWDRVIEYDGKALLSFKQNNRSIASRTELNMGPIDYPGALDHQLHLQHLPVPSELQPPMDSSLPAGGKHCWLHKSMVFFCVEINVRIIPLFFFW